MTNSQSATQLYYVGTYTESGEDAESKSQGIYLYQLDLSSGAFTLERVVPDVINPSFLAIDPQRRYLYAVNEILSENDGGVSAFAINPDDGSLTFLNQQSTYGSAPCHVTVDSSGQMVIVANYLSGNIATYPILADGQLGPATAIIQHQGSSVNPNRQEGPHAHSVTIDAANRYAYAADLGIDKIMIYQLDLANKQLKPAANPSVSIHAGAGPRHFAFHPSQDYGYIINELVSTVTAFEIEPDSGNLTEIQSISTLPAGFDGRSSCADIHISPSGKFLYGSNRGHDSIVIYAIDAKTGRLTLVGHEPTQGQTPRNFAIDPSGTFLLAANQNSNSVVTFRIDPESGKLTPTGQTAHVPKPVCLIV